MYLRIFVFILMSSVLLIRAQNPEEPEKTTVKPASKATEKTSDNKGDPNAKKEGDGPFIAFTQERDYVDVFSYNQQEYIFFNRPRMQKLAAVTCKEQNAKLASLTSEEISNFMAEALSETRLEMDTLWTAGELHQNKTKESTVDFWVWRVMEEEADFVNIEEKVKNFFVNNETLGVQDVDNLSKCLGFGRNNHSEPQFRPLSCAARRPFICQRPRGSIIGESTHPGWIKLGNRFYKIFYDKMNYEQSRMYCTLTSDDNDARLAVVVSWEDAKMLGRYLLIGRPSLENAWIGAQWYRGAYTFKDENLILENNPKETENYPPWLTGKMRKPDGCLLLDRHMTPNTYFVEAKCSRPRPRICYRKIIDDKTPPVEDVIIGDWGYRVVFKMLSWQESIDFCKKWTEYKAKLVEITVADHRTQLLYVMGENRTALDHIWLGGKYVEHTWKWDSGSAVDFTSLDHWVKNETYSQSVDEDYICLNMDRENHIEALFYGTECDYQQFFICLFEKAELVKLQEAERSAPKGGP